MEGRKMKLSVALIMLLLFGVSNQRCSCAIVQFIFGDSLSDVGNNNYLTKSLARAALPWYGIDLGKGLPNGRFTNGRTVADIVGISRWIPPPSVPSVDFSSSRVIDSAHWLQVTSWASRGRRRS